MMKYTFIFLFLIGLSTFSSAQTNVSEGISNTIKRMDLLLTNSNESLKLNSAQTAKLEAVLMEKESRRKSLKVQGKTKSDIFEMYQKLDKEYQPQIDNILSVEQRKVITGTNSSK